MQDIRGSVLAHLAYLKFLSAAHKTRFCNSDYCTDVPTRLRGSSSCATLSAARLSSFVEPGGPYTLFERCVVSKTFCLMFVWRPPQLPITSSMASASNMLALLLRKQFGLYWACNRGEYRYCYSHSFRHHHSCSILWKEVVPNETSHIAQDCCLESAQPSHVNPPLGLVAQQ